MYNVYVVDVCLYDLFEVYIKFVLIIVLGFVLLLINIKKKIFYLCRILKKFSFNI